MEKTVILGNLDAWITQQFSGKKKDGVQLQLERLGNGVFFNMCYKDSHIKGRKNGRISFGAILNGMTK